MDDPRSHWPQMVGSLLVAVAIVAIVIALVTSKFGPTSIAEQEAREDRLEQQEDIVDERQDGREERREEQAD